MIDQQSIWHASGAGLFILLFVINRRLKKSGIFLLAIWNLTGVILHEASHLLIGILLRAEPSGFSIIPVRDGEQWRLGSVRFCRITPFNAVPVALAPLSLAGVAYLAATSWFNWFKSTWGTTVGLYAVIFFLLYNALPSRQDLAVACNWRSLLLYGAALLLIAAWTAWHLQPD